ncbi:MAG: pentapeptide repeat-containing protein [Pseudanabaenales cyanobacterium]|nr:pentapeptide repeat-containing protein [Pseudanabaenales cyanobacterium]
MAWKWKRQTAPRKSREERLRAHTERVAYLVYQNRQLTGKPGDANSDWEKAEKIVQTARSRSLISFWKSVLVWANTPRKKAVAPPKKRILRRFAAWWETTPVEKMLEDIEHLLRNSALLSLLGLIGNVGIIIAMVTYVGTEKQRRDTEILNAWQTITNAAGEPGNGGRIRALEFLNASPGANWRRKFPWFCAPHPLCTWPAERLDGINLSVDSIPEADEEDSEEGSRNSSSRVHLRSIALPGAHLKEANLQGANLGSAKLQGAHLWKANLQGADLWSANLRGAHLKEANLQGADLWSANLQGADLGLANLQGADLGKANLQRTDLRFANLQGSDLGKANLQEADLKEANLEGADLGKANLEGAVLGGANLEGAKGLTEEQLTQAKLCETTLPEYITLDPDRDCDELRNPQPSQ